ncbi:unnamed protein product, partial [marine sediment metagenome]
DKVYADGGIWPYRENDRLGGHDPYSTSKACCELVVDSYRKSFFDERGVRVATARAGNVIGGGDFGADRLVPDIVRAWLAKKKLEIRMPEAVRPWQHVLEPLHGYLLLAECLYHQTEGIDGIPFDVGWNFGASADDMQPVQNVVNRMAACFENTKDYEIKSNGPHETSCLTLDSSMAHHHLKWKPVWSFVDALAKTASWYRWWRDGEDMRAFTERQIEEYEAGL